MAVNGFLHVPAQFFSLLMRRRLEIPTCRPPITNSEPLLLVRPPASCMLAIFLCCLHSHDHRRLIYENRVLYSSTILEFKAFFYPPPPRLFQSPPSQLGTNDLVMYITRDSSLFIGELVPKRNNMSSKNFPFPPLRVYWNIFLSWSFCLSPKFCLSES